MMMQDHASLHVLFEIGVDAILVRISEALLLLEVAIPEVVAVARVLDCIGVSTTVFRFSE